MPIDDMLTAGDSVEEPWARGLPDGQKVLIGSPWQHHGPLCELVSSPSDWCVRMGRHAGDAPVKDCPPGLSVRTQILCSAMSCRWWPVVADGCGSIGAGCCHFDSRPLEMPGPDRSPGGLDRSPGGPDRSPGGRGRLGGPAWLLPAN